MSVDLSNALKSDVNGAAIPPVASATASAAERHFATDHLLTNLKQRTISSGAVTISAQVGKFFLSLVSTMALARLLTPRDFGLVAMVTTVTAFLRVFKDAGLSIATVRREKITRSGFNLFWINVGVSALSTLILAAGAPVIARFYHNPRLIPITLFLSVTFLISGSTIQHQALLKRQMRFKALALIEVSSMTVGVLIGVSMALIGCGYWSLVGLSFSVEASVLVLTWLVSPCLPHVPVRHIGIGPPVLLLIHL